MKTELQNISQDSFTKERYKRERKANLESFIIVLLGFLITGGASITLFIKGEIVGVVPLIACLSFIVIFIDSLTDKNDFDIL